jgi:hypothetical protein
MPELLKDVREKKHYINERNNQELIAKRHDLRHECNFGLEAGPTGRSKIMTIHDKVIR